MKQPLRAVEAKRLAKAILETGRVSYSEHAQARLKKHRMTTTDCENVLRGGAYQEAEWENGGWRHQVHTQKFVVVIEFVKESNLLVITEWRRTS